jgi:hypothetical protein
LARSLRRCQDTVATILRQLADIGRRSSRVSRRRHVRPLVSAKMRGLRAKR